MSARRLVVTFALFALLGYAALAWWGLDHYPLSGDEYSYQLQAEIFSRGRLSVPAPEPSKLFQVAHVLLNDGHVRSKYPPGWPLLLAAGTILGVPWLVGPVLGAACLFLLFSFARRAFDARVGTAAAAIVGLSPFFALNAASFHSHTSTVLALLGALELFFVGLGRGRARYFLGAGAALGYLSLIRPVDAVVTLTALLPLLAWHKKAVGLAILGALPFAPLQMLYQAVQFGNPLKTGYAIYGVVVQDAMPPPPEASYWATTLELVGRWLRQLASWSLPGTLPLLVLGVFVLLRRASKGAELEASARTYLGAFFVLLVVVYGLIQAEQGDAYGPRYLLMLVVPIGVWAGAGAVAAWDWLHGHRMARVGWILAAVALAWSARFGAGELEATRAEREVRRSLFRAAEDLGEGPILVVLRSRFSWYARNGATFDGRVLYVQGTKATLDELRARFPGRSIWSARWIAPERRWNLTQDL